MKKYYILLLSLVTLSCCTNEDEFMPTQAEKLGKVVLSATVEQAIPATRANYTRFGGEFFWTQWDTFYVLNETGRTGYFSMIEGAGTASAKFSGYMPAEDPSELVGAYYGNGISIYRSNDSWEVYLSQSDWGAPNDSIFPEQVSPEEASADIPMYAANDGSLNLRFKMIGGAFAFQFNNIPPSTYYVEIMTDSKVNGDFPIDLNEESPFIETTQECSDYEKGQRFYINTTDATTKRVIYMPVPCGEYNKIEISTYDNYGRKTAYLLSEKQQIVERTNIIYFADVELQELEVEPDVDITEAFEDEIFRNVADRNGDGKVTKFEVESVEYLYIAYRGIKSLKGIEYFVNLRTMFAYNNEIESLDVSKNVNLNDLHVDGNRLKDLNVSGCVNMVYLNCSDNELTVLDVSSCSSLRTLFANGNPLKNVITAPGQNTNEFYYEIEEEEGEIITEQFTDSVFRAYVLANFDRNGDGEISEREAHKVVEIYCSAYSYWDDELNMVVVSDQITTLKGIEYFTNLRHLECADNRIASLDLSQNTKLERIWCYNNQLTDINLNNCTSLRGMNCGENQLTSLDVSMCPNLWELYCNNQSIEDLNVRNCSELRSLECYRNKLTELNVSDCVNLERLECRDNNITSLDLSNNTNLAYLYAYNNPLEKIVFYSNVQEKKADYDRYNGCEVIILNYIEPTAQGGNGEDGNVKHDEF